MQWSEKVRREQQNPWGEVYLPLFILWYDWNKYLYSDFKERVTLPQTDSGTMGSCSE